MTNERLSAERIHALVRESAGWQLEGSTLVRKFEFDDFREAMEFVNQVAQAAEAVDHHPDISISYNKVRLELSTHSAGGLTQKDFDLAKIIGRRVEESHRS